MNLPLMSKLHQVTALDACGQADRTPWLWSLGRHEASTLPATPLSRWLHVESGCVWLTRANGTEQAQDIWLQAGDSLALAAGSAWVLEGWPQAALSLLMQAPAPAGARLATVLRPWARRDWWPAGGRRSGAA